MWLKRIGFFIIVIVCLFIINGLFHAISSLWQKQDLLISAQKQLAQEKKQNQQLKKQLAVVTQQQFVEEEARDKLFLAKPGEGVVIVPQQYLQVRPSATPVPRDTRPNWKKWWDMFF